MFRLELKSNSQTIVALVLGFLLIVHVGLQGYFDYVELLVDHGIPSSFSGLCLQVSRQKTAALAKSST